MTSLRKAKPTEGDFCRIIFRQVTFANVYRTAGNLCRMKAKM